MRRIRAVMSYLFEVGKLPCMHCLCRLGVHGREGRWSMEGKKRKFGIEWLCSLRPLRLGVLCRKEEFMVDGQKPNLDELYRIYN